MDDEILIEVKLDDREIVKQADNIARKLKASLDAALGGSRGGGADNVTRTLKDQEAAAIRLAQAQARLATASGNLSGAQATLSNALAGVNKETITSIGAQTQLIQVQQRMDRALRDLGNTLSTVGSKLTLAVSVPLIGLGLAAVKTATDFDSLKRGLISVSGSSEAAEKQLVRLKEVAKLPGLGFKEAIQGSINLQAAGFSAERSERALRSFGNALATVGKGKAELDGVILALSQIQTKGKVSAEEINQLAERVPQIRRAIIAAFGTADTEVIQKAKITSQQFIDAVVKELEKLPVVTGGAKNTFENLKDSIEQSLLPLGNKLLETILPAIDKLTPKLLGLLEDFSKLPPATQQLVIGLGAAAIAFGPVISAIGNLTKAVVALNAAASSGAFARILQLGSSASVAAIGAGASVVGLGLIGTKLAFDEQRAIDQKLGVGKVSNAEAERRRLVRQAGFNPSTGERLPQAGSPFLLGGTGSDFLQSIADQTQAASPDTQSINAIKLAAANTKKREQKTELEKSREETKRLTEEVLALKADEGRLFEEEFKQLQLRFQREELLKKLKNRAVRAVLTAEGKPLPVDLPPINEITDQQRRNLRVAPLFTAPQIAGFPAIASQQDIEINQAEANRTREQLANQRLRIDEVQIQNQVNRGLLTEADAQKQLGAARRAARDEIIASLEAQREAAGANTLEGLQITEEIEKIRFLGVELSNAERFARGFNGAIGTVGDAFDRLGQNVSRALTSTKDLFNGLKNAVLGFFNDLLGQSLQNVVRQALGGLFGAVGRGVGSAASQQAGAGGLFGNIFRGVLGSAGGAGGGFGTPPFVPAGAGGVSVPPSITATQQVQSQIDQFFGASVPRTAGSIGSATATAGKFSFGALGKSLGAAAPFLGLSLGSGLGGQSQAGNILGSLGGLAAGIGISSLIAGASTTGAFGSVLGLSSIAGPIALAAAPALIVGSILLGRAKQRRADEETSGQFLTQALNSIEQLASGIAADQIEGAQARVVFDTQILATFKQQISGLKTASVRKSRLTNQVRDLQQVYDARIPPLIAEQQKRRVDAARFSAIDSRLVPQFATGGVVPGIDRGRDSVLTLLTPGELVLNRAQQIGVMAQSNPSVFERAGVPSTSVPVGPAQAFAGGGTVQAIRPQIVVDNLTIMVDVGIGDDDAAQITNRGLSEDMLVNKIQVARGRRRNI